MSAALAQILVDANRTRTPVQYRADLEPAGLADCYDIQASVARDLGASVAGWKCGIQDGGKIIFGAPIFASNTRASGEKWNMPKGQSLKIEVEIAIRLGKDLPPRPNKPYSREEILDATAEIFAGIELVGSRFANVADAPFRARLADNFNQAGYVTSKGATNFAAFDLSKLRSKLWIDGALVHDAAATHQQGDPLVVVVAWASNQIDRLGGLTAGQFITTGTLNKPPAVDRPALIEIEIEHLGRTSLQIEN